VKCQDHQRSPDQGTHQQVRGPERRRQELEHHGRGKAYLNHGQGRNPCHRTPERPAGGVGAAADAKGKNNDQAEKSEGQDSMGPWQKGKQVGRREDLAAAEGKTEAEEAGVEVGHLSAKQDHDQSQPGCRQHE
jgi:hypothetical protein